MARPTIMTDELIAKLREAFLIGATDLEACGYADISKQTLYNYQEKHPEFVDQKQAWKNQPILKAKMTVVKALNEPKDAQWYLERKKKDEFSSRAEVTGKDGKDIPMPTFTVQTEEAKKNLEKLYEGSDITND